MNVNTVKVAIDFSSIITNSMGAMLNILGGTSHKLNDNNQPPQSMIQRGYFLREEILWKRGKHKYEISN